MLTTDPGRLAELVATLEQINAIKGRNKFYNYYPDTGKYSRDAYAKHVLFFSLGSKYQYRLMGGGNGTGKSIVGGYETTCHLTGIYPKWWTGKRYTRPIVAWAAGETNKLLRESMQPLLFGGTDVNFGTGMIPGDLIGNKSYTPNTGGLIDYVYVKHITGGWSRLVLKSYMEGRKSFQASNVDHIWFDEEPPPEIWDETINRQRGDTADGSIIMTCTFLSGITPIVEMFLPQFSRQSEEEIAQSSRAHVLCDWEDVPHYSKDEIARKLANINPAFREARKSGIPTVGAGRIYPVEESRIMVTPFPIPKHWPRAYGFDVGWNRTAAIWGALDPETDTLYLYHEYYRGAAEPSTHVIPISNRGAWIPGAIDPASRGRSQHDGTTLFGKYVELGLNLVRADNAVEAGLDVVWERLEHGRLRVFSNLENWIKEYRRYRRDEKGRIIKAEDHLMDATRYLCMTGVHHAKIEPQRSDFKIDEVTFGL